ncbi:unnamed protein product, partial [Linum tenue]
SQGTIVPIERSLQFADKFPDQILDKNQLQRFLGSLNYVLDFYPNINLLCKPLHDRLKKSPPPWSDQHTKIDFLLRIDCQSAKYILEKDVQNLASKQIFARWQAILSIFYFDIQFINGSSNSLPDFLTREFLQGGRSAENSQTCNLQS